MAVRMPFLSPRARRTKRTARARNYRTRKRAGGGGCGAARASYADRAGGLVVLEQATTRFDLRLTFKKLT